jgi:DNA repair protein RecN (Recombination protein N)
MLRFLSIKRLAVIEAAEVEFEPGLNVLTGETGAGKSILVEAVGLLLGGRASGDLVRTGEDAAAIEAIFEIDEPGGASELLLRREVTAQGRSRAFVDGALSTVSALKEQVAGLVELHGQHEHQTLLDAGTHLAIIDAFGRLQEGAADVAARFATWRAASDELDNLRRALSDREARRDVVAFQAGEIERVAPRAGEDDELAATRQVLASADRVLRLCEEGYAALYESDGAVLEQLGAVWRRVAELGALDPRFRPYLEARDGIKSQLDDLASFLRRYADGVEASPASLQQAEERLAQLERLKRRYGPTLGDVLARQRALADELAQLDQGDTRIAAMTEGQAAAREDFLSAARALSERRRQAARGLADALERQLRDLAMEATRFEVRFNEEPLPESAWSASGIDASEFYVSPNPGEDLRPLVRIASGGELSRIMLAIKTLTAASRHGFSERLKRPPSVAAPGLVFDEVDAGIGGRVADVVGRKLHALGSVFQVLCITHLPQIAALADAHYVIAKRVQGGRTVTTVTRVEGERRVEELARMIGGQEITQRIRASAREMVGASEFKAKGESERAKAKTRRM